MESFSDWVHSENYHLQQKGNMYRVQDPPAGSSTGTASRKSVRFTEPAANQNDYTPEPVSSFSNPGQQSGGDNGATVNVMDLNYPPAVDPYDNAGSLV